MSSAFIFGFFLTCLLHGTVMSTCSLAFKDCGEGTVKGKLIEAVYNGTCKGPVAQLYKGTTANISFKFTTDQKEAALTSKVYGKVSVLPYEAFELPNANACVDSGLTCPVAPNTEVQFSANLPISKLYPSVNVVVKWELQNKAGENIFCSLLLATIVSS